MVMRSDFVRSEFLWEWRRVGPSSLFWRVIVSHVPWPDSGPAGKASGAPAGHLVAAFPQHETHVAGG